MKSPVAAAALITFALGGCASALPPQVAAAPAESPVPASVPAGRQAIHAKVVKYAKVYNVPESLIHRSIRRESNYNPSARKGPYWGLMQIRYDTAQGMGYRGPASGLLDPDTNMTYAVAYLANAHKLSGGSESRAIALYAGGYYYEAKRRGMLGQMITASR